MKDELPEYARRLKFLRDRDQVTITKLAQMTHYDKDRLRDFENGRIVPKDWELQTIAEAFKVKAEYFGVVSEGAESDVWKVAPVDRAVVKDRKEKNEAAGKKGTGGKGVDFSDFNYFKEGEKAKAAPAPAPKAEETAEELPPDLFDDSSALTGNASSLADYAPPTPVPSRISSPTTRAAAPPPAKAAAKAAPSPQPPSPTKRSTRSPAQPPPTPVSEPEPPLPQDLTPSPTASDARVSAIECLIYVKALSEVLLQRGLFTAEEFSKALRRARGG